MRAICSICNQEAEIIVWHRVDANVDHGPYTMYYCEACADKTLFKGRCARGQKNEDDVCPS